MSKAKKLKSVLIILLLGIVILQGLWINDAYHERKSHLKDHIQSSVLHSINTYCLECDSLISVAEKSIEKSISRELISLNENIKFKIKLESSKNKYASNKDAIIYKLNCKNNLENKYLYFLPDSTKSYILNSILSWILLSSLFIILLSIFTGIYFRDINNKKQLQGMKDDFIGNMTHELKTPISTISVASEILQNDIIIDNPEKIKQYSHIIFEENNRLKRLVDRVMQVGLFEEGKLVIDKVECNIHKIIDEAYKPLSIVIEKKGGSITVDYQSKISTISIDKNHIKNVISNIIENAIKYTESSPKIHISTISNDDSLIIKIKDNGIGISKKDQKHIFKKYYRAESIENSKTGFGIGLFYVYQIIKAHSAKISVVSDGNNGSVFILQFNAIG